ncbi:MAG: 3-phosphoshikimate 1-carboxyvinyltransferase, partial [Thermodesulfobacteriota bacterium]
MNNTTATLGEGAVDRAKIGPARGLRGELRVPGDKSISHRAIILGSIAEGTTTVAGFLWSEDNIKTLNAFRAMGITVEEREGRLVIEGKGLYGLCEPDDLIDAGNSGTTTRLLAGLLAGQPFFSVLSGDDSLRKRPMKRVTEPLSLMGATIYGREGGNFERRPPDDPQL